MKRRIKYEMVTVVKPELEMRNGRLKLIDIGDIVAGIAHQELGVLAGSMVTDIDVTEVARFDCGSSQVMAKISATLVVDRFEHVRENALNTRLTMNVHDLQVYPTEDRVFEFFRIVLNKLNYAPHERIAVDEGEYHEDLKIRANMPLDDPAFFEDKRYGICGYFYLSDDEFDRLSKEAAECRAEEAARRREEMRAREALLNSDVYDAGVFGFIQAGPITS